MKNILKWARIKSPWVIHFNSGSCNGCDIEIVAALTPRFDIERFGIVLKGTPRHADVLLVTGPVNHHSKKRLQRIYDQMPDPKFVIAIGSCASSGCVFRGCYNNLQGADAVVPVDVYIPGCAPRPDAIIDGVVKLIKKIQGS